MKRRQDFFVDFIKNNNSLSEFKDFIIVSEEKVFIIKDGFESIGYVKYNEIKAEIRTYMIMFGYENLYESVKIPEEKNTRVNYHYIACSGATYYNL